MYFIYSLLLCFGFLVLLPRFLLDAVRHGKYVAGFGERLGSVSPLPKQNQPVIWLHCVSVGETQAARPLVKSLGERFPGHLIVISTITLTGQNLARELFRNEAAKVFYFPFDWGWTVRRTLKAVKPGLVLVMETELWPNFLRECDRQNIPVALVNGRLSQQSFRRYGIIKSFMTRVLSSLQLAVMQTQADAERLCALGMDPDKTLVLGSLKFDAGTMQTNEQVTTAIRERFAVGADSQLVLAASTHAPEERIILEAFRQIAPNSAAKARLLLAPRHPERFAEVAALLEASGRRWSRRSEPAAAADTAAEVILLDSIGELPSIYPLATVVFVGGSIARTGGHNILEPAAVGGCIITGPHTHNFHVIVEAFVEADAIVQLQPFSDSETTGLLASALEELLRDPARRRELGRRAQNLVNENRGATERTVNAVLPLLNSSLSVAQAPINSSPTP